MCLWLVEEQFLLWQVERRVSVLEIVVVYG